MSDASPTIGIDGEDLRISGRRPSLGRILFALSVSLLVFGSMLMCACPGVFAFSVLLAVGSRYYGSSLIQLLSIIVALGGLVLTFGSLKVKIAEQARLASRRAKWAETTAQGKLTNQTVLKHATTP